MKRMPLIILSALLLSGCGQEVKTVDLSALSEELFEAEVFEEQLFEVQTDMAQKALGFSEEQKIDGAVYMGTAATAEELVLLRAPDKETATNYYDLLSEHLKARQEQYSGYLPQEAYKLENAILTQCDTVLVLCIAKEYETAEEIILSHTK